MALKPEMSIGAALAVAAAVYSVYQLNMPSVSDVRSVESDNPDVTASERAASWESAALVSGISLLAKDPTIFVVGGAVTVLLAWKYRHANMVSPLTHKATAMLTADDVIHAQQPDAAPTTQPQSPGYGAAI